MKPLMLSLLLTATWFAAGGAVAAPAAEPWPRWEAHNPGSEARIDHAAWDEFLLQYRREGNEGVVRVDYGAVDAGDSARLDRYIERLAEVRIGEHSRPVQLAYWINLYNALTVDVVLDHYPVDSIRDIDISPGWFADGPWGAKLVEVEGVELSLDDIEHRILRPIWADPRIHYAVNCASIGCPDLQPRAFTADNAPSLLERGARGYVNDSRGAAVLDGELVVSSIYEWFQADFGGTEQGVLEHLRRYADESRASALEAYGGYDDHRYDWSLNDVQ